MFCVDVYAAFQANKVVYIYPSHFTCQNKFFAVLYMSIMGLTCCYKTTVFTFIFVVFLLNLFYRFIGLLLHKPIYGAAKTNGSHTGILLPVSVW